MTRLERVLTPYDLAKRAQRQERGVSMVLSDDHTELLRIHNLVPVNNSVHTVKAIMSGDMFWTTAVTTKPESESLTDCLIYFSSAKRYRKGASRVIQMQNLRVAIEKEELQDAPNLRKIARRRKDYSTLLELLRSERIS